MVRLMAMCHSREAKINEAIGKMDQVLRGRTIVRVERCLVPEADGYPAFYADYPVLFLDDGSQVVLLDGDGFPPLCEVLREEDRNG